MILEYHRPSSLDAALVLLGRSSPLTRPLAGGTIVNQRSNEQFDVVDLQDLSLNHILAEQDKITMGAMVTLQQLVESADLNESVRSAAKADASFNLRQMATVGGTIAAGNGNSVLLTVLSGLHAEITFGGHPTTEYVGDFLPLRKQRISGKLITSVGFSRQVNLAWEKISRTPSDEADLVVCVAQWSSGRTRVVVGDKSSFPRLAMDGTSASGAAIAAKNLFSGVDEYMFQMAPILTDRCFMKLQG